MKKYLLIALFAMMPCFALAQGTTVSQSIVVTNSLGRPLGGVKVEVCTTVSASSPACASAASIFSDIGLSVAIPCSSTTCLTTDSLGTVPTFFASPGTYCYTVSGSYITDTSCHLIILYAATGGTGVVANPSGTQNVSQPAGTYLNVNRFEGVRFADRFANIQAAITDAGTTGSVQIPPTYSGTDTFTNPNLIPWSDLRLGHTPIPQFVPSYANAYVAFGDSMTSPGSGASVPANDYANLVSTQFDYSITNQGVGGNWLQDQANAVFSTPVTVGLKSSVMAGFNDAWQGNPANPILLTYKQELPAMLAWLAIPDTLKSKGNSLACTGTWLPASPLVLGGFGQYSITPGDTCPFTIHGTTAYIVMECDSANGGPFTVTIDGTVYPTTGSYSTTGCAASVATGQTNSAMMVRIPNLSIGKHTGVVTVGAGANVRSIVFIAGNAGVRSPTGPRVAAANIPRLPAGSSLRGGGPTVWGSDANTLAFNVTNDQAIRDLNADGLNVTPVNVANCWNVDDPAQMYSDGIHPNDLGYANIASCFSEALSAAPSATDRALVGRLKDIQIGVTSKKYLGLNQCLMLGGTDDSVNGLGVACGPGFGATTVQGVPANMLSIGNNNVATEVAFDVSGDLGINGSLNTGAGIADGGILDTQGPITQHTANGAQWIQGQISELITLSTVGTTTDSVANLLPANSILVGVTARVTTTITVATDWKLGDASTAGRFTAAIATLTAGTTTVGSVHLTTGITSATTGMFQSAAAKLRITTTGTPGAGVIRVTVFYTQFVPPTS